MASKRAAWVITWDWFGDNRKPRKLLLHILQPRWKVSRVVEHMKFLYLNSELFVPSERLRFLWQKAWRGLIHQEGPRIIIGDNPILVGSRVDDLRIESVTLDTASSGLWPARCVNFFDRARRLFLDKIAV